MVSISGHLGGSTHGFTSCPSIIEFPSRSNPITVALSTRLPKLRRKGGLERFGRAALEIACGKGRAGEGTTNDFRQTRLLVVQCRRRAETEALENT